MMKHTLSMSALTLATALALSACGASTGSDTPAPSVPASSGPAGTSGGMSTGTDAGSEERNDADVMFAQMMIPHHRQAVDMSAMMLDKDGIDPDIATLATTIQEAQVPEIETMTGWLEAWGEPQEPEGGMEGHAMGETDAEDESMDDAQPMDGMMSGDQMDRLEAAEGAEASRLFLESMTAHHEGAITMAQEEIADGQNPEAVRLAETIVATQQAEIERMAELLAAL